MGLQPPGFARGAAGDARQVRDLGARPPLGGEETAKVSLQLVFASADTVLPIFLLPDYYRTSDAGSIALTYWLAN
jgi:hypothetical protein